MHASEIRPIYSVGIHSPAVGGGTPLPLEVLMKNIIKNESGQGLTEYLVLLILISVASITVVTQIGGAISGRFKAAKEKINGMSVNPE